MSESVQLGKKQKPCKQSLARTASGFRQAKGEQNCDCYLSKLPIFHSLQDHSCFSPRDKARPDQGEVATGLGWALLLPLLLESCEELPKAMVLVQTVGDGCLEIWDWF